MDRPLISIIVPIYRVEKYLEQCVRSIMNQTYQRIEIILVDDGSPDCCGKICDELAKEDKRIVVLHKTNGGLSDARNKAMEIMRGKYVAFVDGDDYISDKFVELMLEAIVNNDSNIAISDEEVIKCNKVHYEKPIGSRFKQSPSDFTVSGLEGLEICLRQLYFDVSAWGKLYETTLFDDIRFPTGRVHEDVSTIHRVFLKSGSISFIRQHLYYYRIRESSIMRSYDIKRFEDLLDAADFQEKNVKQNAPNLIESLNSRTIALYFQGFFGALFCCNNVLAERAWSKIKKIRKGVLLSSKARFKTRVAALLSYCGPRVFYCIQRMI